MSETIHAPELESSLGWLNTDRPLLLGGELRGQIVVLDFWTYCCINCMHILPDLAHLEHKYADEPVTFVGVHSAKFANEASRETIRAAILRYEIKHPVVIDDRMKIWRSYAVRSWPTVVMIDPRGTIVGSAAGEGNREIIDRTIAQALAQGRANGTLANGPLEVRREAGVRAASGLSFPGKVLIDNDSGRLFVADSNHNRIVIAALPDEGGSAKILAVVGSGEIGHDDGPAERAAFNHPQGMAVGQGNLYVADTENHLIRAIDLESFRVTTIVGTGEMCNDRAGGGMGTQQGLNSPWDLAIEGSTLYVAMAGTHQIWRIDLPVGFARALAGNGRENIVDGPTETAALAQPSGICIAGGTIYFADSEVSAIRGIDLAAERVFTVIGEGLFSFGDVDGAYPQAKLQHPLGVAAWGNSLLVADTYNHKIKLVDPRARSARTLYGTGRAGASGTSGSSGENGRLEFFEPGGLSVAGDCLYVADTNNHRVMQVRLATGAWQEVALAGLTIPRPETGDASEAIQSEAVSLAAGRDVELLLHLPLPEGSHLSAEAPWSVSVYSDGQTLFQHTGKSASHALHVRLPAAVSAHIGTWRITVSYAICTESDRGLCVPQEVTWTVPIRAGGENYTLTLKAPL